MSDVANLIAAAIVVGLVAGEPKISVPLVLGMAGIWITVLGFALWIVERRS